MILTLKEAKDHLRIEEDYILEDGFITSLILASELYIKNGTDKTFTTNELAKLTAKILVTHWYENREAVGNVGKELEFSIKSILLQLTYCEDGV